jgi:hypothetical protein
MDTLIEILIDNSNSMGPFEADKGNTTYLLPDGSTRMELAKKILVEEVIPKLDYAKNVTVRKFHSITKADKTSEPLIDPVYSGTLDKPAIIAKINAIEIPKNTGGTPITAAVKQSIDNLAKSPNADRKIILVTDGQETDGGDYKKTAEEALKQHGIPCNIFIVGISQDKAAEEKSKALAIATGGTYVNLKAKVYDKPTLQTALRPIYFKAVNVSLQNIIAEQPKPVSPPSPIQAQKVENVNTPQVAEPKSESVYSDTIQKNTIAFNLISKQLSTITEAIEELRTTNKEEDEDIAITENAELNERIRIASESFLYTKLKEKFGSRIKWLNESKESGSIYDFEVIDTLDNSTEYYIECKASMHADKIFLMTKSEWLFFLQNKSKYQLYFVASALTNPTVTKIENLMEGLTQGKVIPLSTKNMKLKADRIVFTIFD